MYDVSFAFQVYLWFEFSNNAGMGFSAERNVTNSFTRYYSVRIFYRFFNFMLKWFIHSNFFFKYSATLVSTYIFLLVDDDDLLMMIMNMLIIDPKGSWDKM